MILYAMYPQPHKLTNLGMRYEQIGFVPKRMVPQGRAGGYLKEINSVAMFTLH